MLYPHRSRAQPNASRRAGLVEIPGDVIAKIFWPSKLGSRVALRPFEQIGAGLGGNGCAFELAAPGIEQPHAWLLSEFRTEIKSIGRRVRTIRSCAEPHFT